MKSVKRDKVKFYDRKSKTVHNVGYEAFVQLIEPKNIRIIRADKKHDDYEFIAINELSNNRYKIRTCTSTRNFRYVNGVGQGISWMLTKIDETVYSDDLFYCLIQVIDDKVEDRYFFRFFLVPSKLVADFIKRTIKEWLENKKSRSKNNNVRQFVLGTKDINFSYETIVPYFEDYEDNWEQLK